MNPTVWQGRYLNRLATALLGEPLCGPSSLLLLPMPACCLAAPTDAEVLLPNALAAAALLLVLLARLPTRLPLLGLLLLLLLLLPTPSLPVRLNKLPALAAAAAAAAALPVLLGPCTGDPNPRPKPAAAAAAGPPAAPSRDAPKPARALLLPLLPGPAALGEPASTGSRRFAIKLEPVGDCRLAELLLLLLPADGLKTPPPAAPRPFGDVTLPAAA
jgi:hypothetical protein